MDRHSAIVRSYLIPGWMYSRELCWLYDAFATSRSHIEVGAFCGKSLFASCAGMAHGSRVHAVESFLVMADKVPNTEWQQIVCKATIGALTEIGINVTLHIGDSLDMARKLFNAGIRVDSLFIDASHEYEFVVSDIQSWAPLVVPGGLIAGHDYWAADAGVMDAVNEVFGSDFEVVSGTRLWFARKQPK